MLLGVEILLDERRDLLDGRLVVGRHDDRGALLGTQGHDHEAGRRVDGVIGVAVALVWWLVILAAVLVSVSVVSAELGRDRAAGRTGASDSD